MKTHIWMTALAVVAASTDLHAQQNWTVKPEWVIGHESFLSSDVLAGRGSATRDEEMAAIYVGGEFESYGLKPAPGMTSYLQAVEVIAPKLDGHATLHAADGSLQEGVDFTLFTSSGASVAGPLVRVAASDLQSAAFHAKPITIDIFVPNQKTGIRDCVRNIFGLA